MIKVFLVSALFAVASGNLFIGLHYTDTQGGDKELEIGVNMNLNGVSNWNNNLSRYKITGDETWEFYDNDNFAGEPIFVKSGPLDWTRVDGVFNDKVSSVKMSSPLYAGLHYTDAQRGDRVLAVNGPGNLVGLDNNLSRFKIPGAETWEFYDNADYAGEPLFVKTGPLDWTRVDAVFNDKVSSVKLAGPLVRILSGDNEPVDSGVNSFQLSEGSSVQAVKGDYTCTAN